MIGQSVQVGEKTFANFRLETRNPGGHSSAPVRANAPPLAEHTIGPMQKLADRYWPGIPVIPSMANGYTDATFLGAAGIPTYGIPGMWFDPDGNGAHGLNERMEVRSVYVGRDYMFDLVKAYAD